VVHHVGPYIVLLPSSGPPEARQIVVVGGNLPTSTQVMLMWSPNGRTSPISTTAYTSRTGALRSQFFVPGTVPGDYSIVAQVNGAPYASARYRVRSFAALSVATKLAGGSVRLGVSGRRFLPDTTLILLLYSAQGAIKPVQLGRVTTNGKGAFSRWLPSRHLPAGQYVLRAWPTGPLAAQTVDTYFQVIL
jgi:hypothetical protein